VRVNSRADPPVRGRPPGRPAERDEGVPRGPGGQPYIPLVSIVTPAYNMGRFVEQTIQSVLSQDYPRIEYVVMDGGSQDETVPILERYSGRLRYESRTDRGAADAIRRGFDSTRGEIVAYLNADDLYLPGAVSAAIQVFVENPDVDVVYGGAVWIDEAGATLGRYPARDFDAAELARECFICQPAAFLRRSAYEAVGGIDPALEYTFDYDLWLRLARRHRFVYLPRVLAQSRMHPGNKTIGARRQVLRETIDTVRASAGYAGFGHVYAYACHLMDSRDQFFEPLKPSWLKYALAFVLGLGFNRLAPTPFLREYLAVMRPSKHADAMSDSSSR
jgi:glycosyltransferase involved in cell wall biosynthesis